MKEANTRLQACLTGGHFPRAPQSIHSDQQQPGALRLFNEQAQAVYFLFDVKCLLVPDDSMEMLPEAVCRLALT